MTDGEVFVPGMRDQPERRYTYGGHVAHLLTYGTSYQQAPYSAAWCRYTPQWGTPWLGSGSQNERDRATRLPVCKRCLTVANTADLIADLISAADVGSSG